jgi:ferric-dicitrate binding protein FerR (iron transport regulator)
MSTPRHDELMVRYLEGIASDEEVAALEAGMQADRTLCRDFVRLAHLQALFADLPPALAGAPLPGPRRRPWAFAVAGAVAALLAIALLWQLRPTDAAGPMISALSGTADGSRAGNNLNVARGDRLRAGDRLTLAGQAELALSWPDGTVVIIAGGSSLTLGGDAQAALTLEAGMLHASVIHDPQRPFSIATKDALACDIGTEFTVQADPGGTVVRVEQGVVTLANGHGMVVIAAGASARAAAGQGPRLEPAANAAVDPGPVPAAKPPAPAEPGSLTVSGTVTAVDGARHSFTLTDGISGTASEYRAYFAGGNTAAIQARIARITVGDALSVTYVDKEGRRAIRIEPASAAHGIERKPGP